MNFPPESFLILELNTFFAAAFPVSSFPVSAAAESVTAGVVSAVVVVAGAVLSAAAFSAAVLSAAAFSAAVFFAAVHSAAVFSVSVFSVSAAQAFCKATAVGYGAGIIVSRAIHKNRHNFVRNMFAVFLFSMQPPCPADAIHGLPAVNDNVRITQAMYDDLLQNDLFEILDASRFGKYETAMAHGMEDDVINPDAARRFADQFRIPVTRVSYCTASWLV